MKRLVLAAILFCSTTALSYSLDEKLEKQWERYELAQEALLKRVHTAPPDAQLYMSRDEWERYILPPKSHRLTPKELRHLQQRQKQRIALSLLKSQKESLINLDEVRNQGSERVADLCQELPKGGMLHIHPSGTLMPDLARTLVRQNNPGLPTSKYLQRMSTTGPRVLYRDELDFLRGIPNHTRFNSLNSTKQEKMLEMLFLPDGSHFFPRFESVFSFIGLAIESWDDFFKVLWEFAERNSKIGVSYVEFTSSSSSNKAMVDRVEKVYREKFGITVRFNKSFSRNADSESQKKAIRALLNQEASPFLTGIDLLSEETHAPAFEKGQLIYAPVLAAVRAGRSSLRRTMHSGEHGDVRNPRDAILLGAERLGHGVQLLKDPIALEYAIKKQIGIEANLISNLRLRSVRKIQNHPFLKFLRLGLPVSLSTDDEGIFKSSLLDDCVLAVTSTDITYDELKRLAYNAIHSSFADELTKKKLLSKLNADFVRFEKNWVAPSKSKFKKTD